MGGTYEACSDHPAGFSPASDRPAPPCASVNLFIVDWTYLISAPTLQHLHMTEDRVGVLLS